MVEVTGLYSYPLTGARATSQELAVVHAGGIDGSRELVLYTPTDEGFGSRVSQAQFSMLAQVTAEFDADRQSYDIRLPGEQPIELPRMDGIDACLVADSDGLKPHLENGNRLMPIVSVDEFGDMTECIDVGDDLAFAFQSFLESDGIRLAQKTKNWRRGLTGSPVMDRANSPLHIMSEATVTELQGRAGPSASFGHDRFRPDIVVGGDLAPFEERDWVGGVLQIGGGYLEITRDTKRCHVPGLDQLTGVNKKDVPKLYRNAPHVGKKAVIGVYAAPIMEENECAFVNVGDRALLL